MRRRFGLRGVLETLGRRPKIDIVAHQLVERLMQLNDTERCVLADLIATLRRDFSASRVLLYGSAARDQLQEGSDIDLLVVLPKVDWEIEKQIVERCFQAELKCSRVISAACFTNDELTRTPLRVSPFVLNVHREGIEL